MNVSKFISNVVNSIDSEDRLLELKSPVFQPLLALKMGKGVGPLCSWFPHL